MPKQAVEKARKQIAEPDRRQRRKKSSSPAAPPNRTTWRIKGVAEMYAEKGNHIITAATEHKAVLDTCKRLEKKASKSRTCRSKADGLVDLDMLRDAITRQDDPRQHHVRQQRDRRDAAGRARSARSARNAASCSTPTPCRPSARFRWT